MKKLLLMTSLFLTACAWGQTNPKIFEGELDDFKSTIPEFSYQGKVALYSSAKDENRNQIFSIYDDNIELSKTITIPYEPYTTYKKIDELARVDTVLLYRSDSTLVTEYPYEDETGKEVWVQMQSWTAEDVREMLNRQGRIFEEETKNGIIYFYVDYFYKQEIYGTLYPHGYFCLFPDQKLYAINSDWQSSYSYSGELIEGEFEEHYTNNRNYLENFDYDNYDENYAHVYCPYLNQTLFNDDEKFEYIVPIIEESTPYVHEYDRDHDGIVDRWETMTSFRSSGFYVKSEDGTILQTIKYEDGYYGDVFQIFKINGKVYTSSSVYKEVGDRWEYATIIYEIDKQSNAIKKVATHTGMKVHPTVANPSEPITIELGEDTDIHEIHVVNAAGQTVKRIPVNEGQRQVVIKSQGLSQGMNIINATGPQQKYNSKIFVK